MTDSARKSSKTKTNAAKEEARPALMPKLRFPEFRGAEGWKLIPLKDLADRGKKKNRDEKIERVLTNSAEFGVVDQRDFFDKDIATQGKLESYVVVELGDYVYNPRISATAAVGPISKNNIGTGVMSPLYKVFRFKNPENGFYQHYFKTTGWHTYMRQASSTGARHDRMAIGSDDFMAMPLPVAPSPTEQQKIAECLSSVDDLMAAQARKVDALKTHKKGLMQQLFPREGETQPRLRFPEFQSAGEWESHTLGNVVTISKGKGVAKADVVENGTTPCIRYAELYTIYGEVISDVMSRTNVPVDNLILSEAGDVIVPASGETKEDIATCACVLDAGVALGSDLNVLRSGIDGRFFSYYLNGCKRAALARVAQGDTVAHLYPSQISKLGINCPSDLAEQQRIADCLSSLDALITAESQKLKALKAHKKGLMQQLFPSPEVVEA